MRTYTGWALGAVYTHVCTDEAIHEAVHVVLLVSVHMFNYLHHKTVYLCDFNHSSPLHNTHLNIQIV